MFQETCYICPINSQSKTPDAGCKSRKHIMEITQEISDVITVALGMTELNQKAVAAKKAIQELVHASVEPYLKQEEKELFYRTIDKIETIQRSTNIQAIRYAIGTFNTINENK